MIGDPTEFLLSHRSRSVWCEVISDEFCDRVMSPRLRESLDGNEVDAETSLGARSEVGDCVEFRRLVIPHLDALYTYCLHMTHNAVSAEAFTRETLRQTLQNMVRLDSSGSFRPWLLSVATNLCRDHLRESSVARTRLFGIGHSEDGELDGNLDFDTVDIERDLMVRKALGKLPFHYRVAVALVHIEGMEYQEMSQITEDSVKTLRHGVRRGRTILSEIVREIYPQHLAHR